MCPISRERENCHSIWGQTSDHQTCTVQIFFAFFSFQSGSVKVKCTAMLQDVYLKSNEISFEVKGAQNAPVMESREKDGKLKASPDGKYIL